MAINDNDDATRNDVDKTVPQQSRSRASTLEENQCADKQASTDSKARGKDAMTASRQPKLDGVLYHYYSKTLAAIIHSRLTHYDVSTSNAQTQALNPSTPLAENTNQRIKPATATSDTSRKANKWFDLDLTDYEIFREEIRLWRNISTLIPVGILDGSSSLKPSSEVRYVPAMIVDVILDPSLLTEREKLLMDQSDPEGSKAKRRIQLYQDERGDSQVSSRRGSKDNFGKEKEAKKFHQKPIILETWKLELDVCNLSDPPDLPVLYRQATSNLRELLTIAKQLPIHTLFERLQRAKTSRVNDRSSEKLNLGVRLRTEGDTEEEDQNNDIIGLRQPLGEFATSSSDQEKSLVKITEIFSFETLLTAVGILSGSVEYRLDSDFFVEDVEGVIDAARNQVDLDEDFFRPSVIEAGKSASKMTSGTSTKSHSPSSLEASKPRSVPPTNSDRTQGNTIPVLQSESSQQLRNTSSTSVFSTSASSGRPVAGLANLRRSPSITTHGSSPNTTMTAVGGGSNTASTSPASQTTSSISDAAFLTNQRRTSTGERKLRSFNTLSSGGERNSPPGISSGSPLQHSPLTSRPALARASISANTSLRTGSYSPSSPSPLAQHTFTNQQHQLQQQGQNTSQYRASSSPSNRVPSLPLSTSPSLRSIFQAHSTPPSQSHLSISSLSRTPPHSLIESSSIGLQRSASNTVDDTSSQQSCNLAEGRQKPSVAPQMIKRYSSTFNYRQGRQSANKLQGTGPEEIPVEGEISFSAPYSKSWQARIDQRHNFAARSLGRGEESSSGSLGAFATSFSPRLQRRRSNGISTSQEEDLDDFVRMIDLNHPTSKSAQVAAPTSPNDNRLEGAGAAAAAAAAVTHPTSSSSTFSPSNTAIRQRSMPPNPMSYSTIPSGIGFNRQIGWNRNQVDELLNKMQSSIREFSTSSTSKGSGTSSSIGGGSGAGSGGAQSDSQSPASQNSQFQNTGNAAIPTAGYSPSFARSPLSKIGFSAVTTNNFISAGLSSRISSSAATTNSPPPAKASISTLTNDQQRQRNLYGDVSMRSQVMRGRLQEESSNQSSGLDIGTAIVSREGGEDIIDSIDRPSHRHHHHSFDHTRRSTSGGSIESLSQQPHSYDPLEDEAVGRLELVHDDIDASPEAAGTGNNNGNGRGQQHHHHHHENYSSEAARRRADFELARNFGQVVSSGSSRGGNPRASLSPWRNRMHHRGGASHNSSTPASPSMPSTSGTTSPSGTGTGTGNSTAHGGD